MARYKVTCLLNRIQLNTQGLHPLAQVHPTDIVKYQLNVYEETTCPLFLLSYQLCMVHKECHHIDIGPALVAVKLAIVETTLPLEIV